MSQNIDILISAKDNATRSISNVSNSLNSLKTIGGGMNGAFKKIESSVITAVKGIGVGILGLGAYGIKTAGDLEQTRVAFINLYGSAEKAGKTIKSLVDFSNATPFEMPEVTDMALKLKNVVGVTDKELIPTLTILGDIASSQGKGLSQMVEAFMDATTGEFERLKEFGIKSKQSGDEVSFTFRGQTETVKKTKEEIGAYLAKIGEMQGIQGSMALQSQTLNGLFSTFKDTVMSLTRNLVGMLETGEIIKGGLFDKLKIGLTELMGWIEKNKVKIKEFGDSVMEFGRNVGVIIIDIITWIYNHKELVKNILIGITALYAISKAIALVTTAIGVIKLVLPILIVLIKGLGTALMFLATNPIGLVITALAVVGTALYLVWKNWDKIKPKLIQVWEDIKLGVTIIIQSIQDKAFEWGRNLMKMYQDGMQSKVNDIVDAVYGVALSISDYLGFGSPTKKGPGAKSDEWMPNLMDMLAGGLSNTTKIEQASMEIAKAIGKGFDEEQLKNLAQQLRDTVGQASDTLKTTMQDLEGKIGGQKDKITGLKNEYSGLKDKLKEVGIEGTKALQEIQDKLDKQVQTISGIKSGGQADVGQRAIKIEEEIKALQEEQKKNSAINNQEKITQLQTELALATAYAGNEAIEKQRIENAKSETQLIIDKTNQKLLEAETERTEIIKTYEVKKKTISDEQEAIRLQMEAKKKEILTEATLYKSLILGRQELEVQYFSIFQKNINEQIDKTKEAIRLMNELNNKTGYKAGTLLEGARANGGPVGGGQSYLVGERGPEIFTPRSSGNITPNNAIGGATININMGGVSVGNQQDADYFATKITEKITRQLQLQKLGIS